MVSLTEDQRQKILTALSYVTELFKLTMGCLLAVFVPQRCPEHTDQLCTFRDNFVDLIPYNQFALAMNFITLAGLIGFYTVEYKRESWCIKYLDQDREKSDEHLKEEMMQYPAYRERLMLYNSLYYRGSTVALSLAMINLVCSSVLTMYYYYLDYRSVTTVFTNSLLILEKLYHSRDIAQQSQTDLSAVSAYLVVPMLYNTIDEDFRHPAVRPRQPFQIHMSPERFRSMWANAYGGGAVKPLSSFGAGDGSSRHNGAKHVQFAAPPVALNEIQTTS
jgi:hypothetical protein